MESGLIRKHCNKKKRACRVRSQLRGSMEKPRLSVQKTNKHIHVQLIDDESGVTIASTSTIAKAIKEGEFSKKNKASAKHLGLLIADLAKEKNVKRVVFDRGPFKYHGVIAALADGAREGGLEV